MRKAWGVAIAGYMCGVTVAFAQGVLPPWEMPSSPAPVAPPSIPSVPTVIDLPDSSALPPAETPKPDPAAELEAAKQAAETAERDYDKLLESFTKEWAGPSEREWELERQVALLDNELDQQWREYYALDSEQRATRNPATKAGLQAQKDAVAARIDELTRAKDEASSNLATVQAELARLLSNYTERLDKADGAISKAHEALAGAEAKVQLAAIKAEVDSGNDSRRAELEQTQKQLAERQEAKTEAEIQSENLQPASPESPLGELDGTKTFSGDFAGTAGDTVTITEDLTLQERLQRDAFADLATADAVYYMLEKVDQFGQGAQYYIGFVPGMDVADTALSAARGFAESLGEEISRGTSWDDTLKIAAVNAGLKGAISLVGNRVMGGADSLAERVTVLSKAGFTNLTVKQIAEGGAKGMSYVVVKTTQTVSSEVASELSKPAMGKVADWVRSDSSGASSQPTLRGGGATGFSTVTQPLVSY